MSNTLDTSPHDEPGGAEVITLHPPEPKKRRLSFRAHENRKALKNLHMRDKIRASVILERLERNALGELEPPMTANQIKSAEILLRKVMPDLGTLVIKGDPFSPVKTESITRIVLTGPMMATGTGARQLDTIDATPLLESPAPDDATTPPGE